MTPSLKTESASETGHAQPQAVATTAGQLLREARAKAGMHLAVLSVTLKVPVRELEALETDALDPAKGPVFYRGLASSVCRHLQTDPAPILALLPHTSAHLRPLRSAIEPLPSRGSPGMSIPLGRVVSSKVFWSAALMVLLTGAFLWLPGPSQWAWLDDVKSLMAEEAVSQDVSEPIAAVPVLDPVAPLASPDASTPAPAAEAPAAVSPVSTSLTPAAPEWVFSATAESWLEVRNAQKAVVWSGLLKAGESTRIQSPLPVSVVVGRAEVVTATLRGQPFDLKPHTQVTVARFEVKE